MEQKLYWDAQGRIGCDKPGHAPYRGSDTWRNDRWKQIPAKAVEASRRQLLGGYICETCRYSAEKVA